MRLRRIVGAVTLAAALLVATPLTAHADPYEYPADEPPIGAADAPRKSVSLDVKEVGETTIVQLYLDATFPPDARSYLTVTGEGLSDDAIEIAGVAESVTSAVDFTARFGVTIEVPGEFVVQGYAVNLAGQRVTVYEPQTITVVDPAADVADPAPELPPVTGPEWVLFAIGALLLAAVIFFFILGKRRRREDEEEQPQQA